MSHCQFRTEGSGRSQCVLGLLLWASEYGNSDQHDFTNLLWLLGGNVGDYFKTGRVVNCGGRTINDLHTTNCNAYGITDNTIGNPAYCDGPLPLT